MAKAGNFAAYQQLRPLQGDISDDIKYWNEDRDAKRAQQTYEDELAYQKQQKIKEEKQANYDKYVKPLNNYDTGSKTLNEFNARMITQAKEKYLPLMQTLNDPNASEDDKMKARLNLQEINSFPDKLKIVTDQYTAQWNAYQTAKEKGLAWENPEMEKAFQNGFGTFQGGIDENMNPIIAFKDVNGDGENDIMAVQNYDEISAGMPLFDFQKKHNIEALAKTIAGELGTTEDESMRGYTTTKIEAVRADDIETRAQKLLFGEDGKITSVTKSALKERGIDPGNAKQEDYDAIKQDIKTRIGTYLTENKSVTTDLSARTAANKEARLARESGATKGGFGEPVIPSEQTWGTKVKDISGKSVGISNVTIGAVKGKDNEVTSNANVKNYSYKNDGTMLLDVEYPKTKSISDKEYKDTQDKAAKGDETASEALARMIMTKTGDRRITIPGTNDKKVIEVSPEDEASVAKAMGTTITEMKQRAGYNTEPTPEPKSEVKLSDKSSAL